MCCVVFVTKTMRRSTYSGFKGASSSIALEDFHSERERTAHVDETVPGGRERGGVCRCLLARHRATVIVRLLTRASPPPPRTGLMPRTFSSSRIWQWHAHTGRSGEYHLLSRVDDKYSLRKARGGIYNDKTSVRIPEQCAGRNECHSTDKVNPTPTNVHFAQSLLPPGRRNQVAVAVILRGPSRCASAPCSVTGVSKTTGPRADVRAHAPPCQRTGRARSSGGCQPPVGV